MGDGTFRLSIVALLASCMAGLAGGREPLRSQEVKNPLRVDAALRGAGSYAGYTYVFRGGKYRRLITSSGVFDDGGSLPVFAFHLPPAYHAGVDAALSGAGTYAGKGYFFLGSSYARTTGRPTRSTTRARSPRTGTCRRRSRRGSMPP